MASGLLQHLKTPQSPARKLGDHEQRDVHIFHTVFHILVSYEQVCALPDHSQTEATFSSCHYTVPKNRVVSVYTSSVSEG